MIARQKLIEGFESGIKKRKTFRYWEGLEKTQWLPTDQLEDIQFNALRRLISYAESHCPYYQDAWKDQGLQSKQLKTLEDFRRWPTTDREVIRQNRQAMRSSDKEMKLIAKATGGSSGTPLQFDLNNDSHDRRVAASFRGYQWGGAGPGTKQLYLWGVPLGNRSSLEKNKDRLYDCLYNRVTLNTFELSEQNVIPFFNRLNKRRPQSIIAYTNAIYAFASMLADRGLKPYSPDSIIVGAEKLHDFQRERIESVFQAPVFETYGSREFMLIGAECDRHQGLHLTMEHLIVEILDDDGRPTPDGDEGNIVITDLYNYGMPFIRYATGDRAVAGFRACSCGRGLPLLKKVTGRRLDMLTTPDGRKIPGEFFPHLVKDYVGIQRFQVVQERLDHIRLRAVVNEKWTEADRQRLDDQVRDIIGTEVEFSFDPVDEIPLTSAGKLQVVVNRCAS